MRQTCALFAVVLSFCFIHLPADIYNVVEKTDAIEAVIEKLPHSGVLKDSGRGFVYVKVDDDYIYKLFPLVKKAGYDIPPYFRRPDAAGAHISVFYEEESKRLPDIQEIGRYFTFEPVKILEVYAGRGNFYIVLEVKSPELERLREKYGLSPLLKGYPFHISIAKKQKDSI